MTGQGGRLHPVRASTRATRSSPNAIDCGWRVCCHSSQSARRANLTAADISGRSSARFQRRLAGHQPEHRCDAVSHVAAVEDQVERAVLKQKLTALEAFGQRLADRLLD